MQTTKIVLTIEEVFAQGPSWAEGLPLKGAGYTGPYYFKD